MMYRGMLAKCVAMTVGSLLMGTAAQAAMVASDAASNAVYTVGEKYDGLNGGTGFQPWVTVPNVNYGTNNGAPLNNSSQGYNSLGANAFSLYAFDNGGMGSSSATRAFTDNSGTGVGALDAGQTFAFDFDNHWVANGGTVGFELNTTAGVSGFRFDFAGGGNAYRVTDSAGVTLLNNDVAVFGGYTDTGLHLSVTLTSASTYSFTATRLVGGLSITQTGTLATASTGLDRLVVFDRLGGGESNLNFTNLSVSAVPEPASLGLLGLASVSLLSRRRHA